MSITVAQWMGAGDRRKYRLLCWSADSRWNEMLHLLPKSSPWPAFPSPWPKLSPVAACGHKVVR